MNNALPLKHTPPLGYAVLTPLYDLAIAILTRENIWRFLEGFVSVEQFEERDTPTKIISSLVLHQVPLEEKSRILKTMHQIVAPAGACFIADYGLQKSWFSKTLFRLTVQALDGVENTSPNAQGILPDLMRSAGFETVTEVFHVSTFTGVIYVYKGLKGSKSVGE